MNLNRVHSQRCGIKPLSMRTAVREPEYIKSVYKVMSWIMVVKGTCQPETQATVPWHVTAESEINFHGRGNSSRETGCSKEVQQPRGSRPWWGHHWAPCEHAWPPVDKEANLCLRANETYAVWKQAAPGGMVARKVGRLGQARNWGTYGHLVCHLLKVGGQERQWSLPEVVGEQGTELSGPQGLPPAWSPLSGRAQAE